MRLLGAGCNCDGLLMSSVSRSKSMYVFNQTGHDYFMPMALGGLRVNVVQYLQMTRCKCLYGGGNSIRFSVFR